MKIYTKTGDGGMTALIGGTRVSKADLRLDTYGTADELNSFIGLLRAKDVSPEIDQTLHTIQNKLFNLGAYLATDTNRQAPMEDLLLTATDVQVLEAAIDAYTAQLEPMRGFILPAGNEVVALAHVCRTITRRLERLMVALLRDSAADRLCLQYVNRLSDYFFTLARLLAHQSGLPSVLWEK